MLYSDDFFEGYFLNSGSPSIDITGARLRAQPGFHFISIFLLLPFFE